MTTPIDRKFWKSKKILLTGHTGFIGGWLYFWLNHLGADVMGYALKPTGKTNFFTSAKLAKLGKSKIGDIRDLKKFRKTVVEFQPQIILHLAAQALVRPAYADPLETLTTNIDGTANILQIARECKKLQSALIFTTDKVYENIEVPSGYREDAKLGGYEPYGASKACAEIVTSAFWHSYFKNPLIPMATLRAGNVIGGGDWSVDRLIPDAVRAFNTGKPLTLRHPEAIRPWQHVLEPCYAILLMIQQMHKKPSPLFGLNIGPDAKDCLTVGAVAESFTREWNRQSSAKAKWRHTPDDSIYEAKLLMLDNSRAKKMLSWQPRWNAEQTVRQTVAWYLAHARGENMSQFTKTQIDQFTSKDSHV